MFFGQINNYLVPAGEAETIIPIKTIMNTNEKVINKRGVISFLKNGKYNVDASISVSADTPQNVNVNVYTDDGVRTSVLATIPEAPSADEPGTVNISLIDAIEVILTRYRNIANIYIGVDQSNVTVNGYVRVEYMR